MFAYYDALMQYIKNNPDWSTLLTACPYKLYQSSLERYSLDHISQIYRLRHSEKVSKALKRLSATMTF